MKVVPQPIGKKDRTQRPSQNQPVKTRQRSRDLVLMLRDKLVHGASALLGCSPLSAEQSYERLKRLPFLVAATPRCVSVVISKTRSAPTPLDYRRASIRQRLPDALGPAGLLAQ